MASLAGTVVPMPVRFGGRSSRLHDVALRFGPVEPDGVVPGHLVAQMPGPGGPVAARWAVVWDPLLETFTIGDAGELDRLFRRLDPLGAFSADLGRSLADGAAAVVRFIAGTFVPRFFVVGTVGAILVVYAVYYWLWAAMAEFLLLYAVLPGAALAAGCWAFGSYRSYRLEAAMFRAAWHAYGPDARHAPR